MIRLLMLGSSHSACFKQMAVPADVQLNIFANRGNGLFSNLSFRDSGHFELKGNTNPWDKKVFLKSGEGASQNINDYTHLVVNIGLRLNLPMLFHGDKDRQTVENMILSMSNALRLAIIENAFSGNASVNQTIKLIDTMVGLGFVQKNIFVLVTPFSSASPNTVPETNLNHSSSLLLESAIKDILFQSQSFARNKKNLQLILPDTEMFEMGMFLHHSYSVPDSVTNWRNLIEDKIAFPADRIHKNQKYGKIMFQKILRTCGI